MTLSSFHLLVLTVVGLTATLVPGRGQDDSSVSFQTFYDQLGSQGTWVQTGNYGYAWQPSGVDSNWQPYTDGHWVYTDAGWTWDSNEPWGWATYHYGRWINLDGEGWVWVPGYTWGPAWVSWRYGDGYCGWAPLPPETAVGIDFGDAGYDGFHIGGDCDIAFGIGAGWYTFCPIIYLGADDYRPYYLNRFNNYGLINRTVNVTNINVTNGGGAGRFGRVNVGGPSFAMVNAQAQTPIQQATLTEASQPGRARLEGQSLAVYAPRVSSATGTEARPMQVARSLGTGSVNRGTDINRPLLSSAQGTLARPTSEQVQAAAVAQGQVPERAKVATSTTQLSRPLTQPMSVYQRTSPQGQSTHATTVTAPDYSQSGNRSSDQQKEATAPSAIPTYPSSSEQRPSAAFPSSPTYSNPASSTPHESAPSYHPSQTSGGSGQNNQRH